MEIRDKTRKELDDRFDLRKFHDVVLKNGAMPLNILERVVEAYITSSTQ